MRAFFFVTLTTAAVSLGAVVPTDAMPIAVPSAAPVQSDIEQARLYCFSTVTGAFLHWGRCGGYRFYRPVYRYYRRPGRVYCYSTRTGRFLHWGHC